MPEVDDDACKVEEMSDDEREQAAEEAVDATSDAKEVSGFAPRDS